MKIATDSPASLSSLVHALRSRVELGYKKDIQAAAGAFGDRTQSGWFPAPHPIENGDDTAALFLDGGYVLFAAEGMRAEFVSADPWFAGFSSVLANVNDIAAMGGRPWAVVDVLFWGTGDNAQVLKGIADASDAFGVPVVGGHTTRTSSASMLAVAVVGRANRLIRSAGARAGQVVLAAISMNGSFRGAGGNFDATAAASPVRLRTQLRVLPEIAEAGLVAAGKDISMAGLCGTLVMMLEASSCGARIDLASVPAPAGVDPLRWLTAFPSFGFLLTTAPSDVASVCERFDAAGVVCAPIGTVTETPTLDLVYGGETATYWDLRIERLTGFGTEMRG